MCLVEVLNALARMREGLLRTGGQESLHSALRQFIKEEREDLDKLGLHANLRSPMLSCDSIRGPTRILQRLRDTWQIFHELHGG